MPTYLRWHILSDALKRAYV